MVCFLEIEFCVHNLGLWIPLQEPGVKAPCSVSHLNLLVDTGLAHATSSWTQEEEAHMVVLRQRPGGTHLSSVLSTWPCCHGRRAEGFGSLLRPCTVEFVTSLGARIPGWLNARGWAWPSLAVSLRTGMPREQVRSSDQRHWCEVSCCMFTDGLKGCACSYQWSVCVSCCNWLWPDYK